jgi:hypothetical protein
VTDAHDAQQHGRVIEHVELELMDTGHASSLWRSVRGA